MAVHRELSGFANGPVFDGAVDGEDVACGAVLDAELVDVGIDDEVA